MNKQILADIYRDLLRHDEKDYIAEQIAVNTPCPGEVLLMSDVSTQAKETRYSLLADIEKASSLEEAKAILLDFIQEIEN